MADFTSFFQEFSLTLQMRNGRFGNGRFAFSPKKITMMKFYNREKELAMLKESQEKAASGKAQFVVLTGRRRVGKTTLIKEAYMPKRAIGSELQQNEEEKNANGPAASPFLYFFVGRKPEKVLCGDFADEITQKLGIPLLGTPSNFSEIMEMLMKYSQDHTFTLFIDEFQDFYRVNSSVFSDLQRLWDRYADASKINLVVGGSVNTLMNKIFRNAKEPLYGRQTALLKLRPFAPKVLKEILADFSPNYAPDDLLCLYMLTGGVAKYVALLLDDAGATTKEQMIEAFFSENSFFLEEGKFLLTDEFGRDYSTYFSILSLIASGHTRRSEIESAIGTEIGGYITNLRENYELITPQLPLFQKAQNKNMVYALSDNFLTFWFRFVYRYSHIVEIQAFRQLKQLVARDYDTFSGRILEKYFKEKMEATQDFTRIGSWWNRRGESEIDIIAANEILKTAKFFEVKRNREAFRKSLLEEKVDEFLKTTGAFKGYTTELIPLTLEDM